MVKMPYLIKHYSRGLYIGKYPPPPRGDEISANVIWGKNMKMQRIKKRENVKEKGRKGEEKGRKGKENEIRRSKRVK